MSRATGAVTAVSRKLIIIQSINTSAKHCWKINIVGTSMLNIVGNGIRTYIDTNQSNEGDWLPCVEEHDKNFTSVYRVVMLTVPAQLRCRHQTVLAIDSP